MALANTAAHCFQLRIKRTIVWAKAKKPSKGSNRCELQTFPCGVIATHSSTTVKAKCFSMHQKMSIFYDDANHGTEEWNKINCHFSSLVLLLAHSFRLHYIRFSCAVGAISNFPCGIVFILPAHIFFFFVCIVCFARGFFFSSFVITELIGYCEETRAKFIYFIIYHPPQQKQKQK